MPRFASKPSGSCCQRWRAPASRQPTVKSPTSSSTVGPLMCRAARLALGGRSARFGGPGRIPGTPVEARERSSLCRGWAFFPGRRPRRGRRRDEGQEEEKRRRGGEPLAESSVAICARSPTPSIRRMPRAPRAAPPGRIVAVRQSCRKVAQTFSSSCSEVRLRFGPSSAQFGRSGAKFGQHWRQI